MMLNRMLRSNKKLFAVAISGLLLTASCRKAVDQQAPDASLNDVIGTEATTSKAFSFTEIPFSNTDLITTGRGIEKWNNVWGVNVPAGSTSPANEYNRFGWLEIEGNTQGSYKWDIFDRQVKIAIDNKRKFGFGIMPLYTGTGSSIGGAKASFPTYIHTQMQTLPSAQRDWNYNGNWIPNWNSEYFLSAWERMLNAVANRIATTTYKGVKYSDVISYIDIRGYGDFGEWHTWPWTNKEPSGRKATVVSLKRIIDSHVKAFPNTPLVNLVGAFDNASGSYIPAEVSYYALTKTNNMGKFGWRRDNFGDPNTDVILSRNPYSYNGVQFKTLILDAWKYGPVVGEPLNSQGDVTGSCGSMYCDLERQVRLYHATSFGNGNYPSTSNQTMKNNIIASSKATGYRIKILSGDAPASITRNSAFSVKTVWQNVGIAPAYDNWNVVFELQNSSGTAVASSTSSFKLRLFLPATTGTTITDNFTLPSSVAAGTYKLVVRVKDPANFTPNMKLAINGVNADGSYTLNSAVTVN